MMKASGKLRGTTPRAPERDGGGGMPIAPRPRRHEPTPGMDAHSRAERRTDRFGRRRRVPTAASRAPKILGTVGFVLLLAALGLVAVTIVAGVLDWMLWPWIVATVVVGGAALVCLFASRRSLTAHDGADRAQHDPLLPEVTAEEAAAYERHHPHSGPENRR